MPAAIPILFGACLTVAVCVAAGGLLLRALRVALRPTERVLFAFVAGAACWSAAIFVLCSAGLAYRGVLLGAGAAVLAARALEQVRGFRSSQAKPPAPPGPRLSTGWRVLFTAVFGLYAVLYFFNAMAPEISPDGSTYHLGLVARYVREHGFPRITTNMYANLSQGLEMLFVYAFAFGRHSAAALVHFAFLLALPLAMLSYGRRFGFPRAGAAAALLAFAAPVVGKSGTSAYNDVAVACVLFGVFYALEIWDQERQPGLLAVAGLLAGFAYALKYTAFLAVPYALGYVAWKLLRGRKPALVPLAVVAGFAALMIVPWMAKNWIILGNPLSPFFNDWFPNPYVHIAAEKEYAANLRSYGGLPGWWAIPLEVTVKGALLQGLLGPVFLLAPLALVSLRYAAGRRLLFAWAFFSLAYAANVGTRFLIPGLPFLALSLALAVANSPGIAPALVLAQAFFSWPAVMSAYCDQYAWRLNRMPEHAALRRTPEQRFLRENLWEYDIARAIEDHVPPGGRVFSFNPVAEAYTQRQVLVGYQAALNNTIGDILYTPVLFDLQPRWRMTARFKPVSVARLRLVQTARAPEQWGVNELRVYRQDRELPRAPAWRLRAQPNPWDVQMAFDNSLATRWKSWQPMSPGMYLEIDFGAKETVDAMLVQCAPDQGNARLAIEGEVAPGRWLRLPAQFEKTAIPYPEGLRRAAAEELKARGVDYLLENDSDILAKDMLAYSKLWGFTELVALKGTRLYRIE